MSLHLLLTVHYPACSLKYERSGCVRSYCCVCVCVCTPPPPHFLMTLSVSEVIAADGWLSVEHWWNDTNWTELYNWEKNVSHCQYTTNTIWSGSGSERGCPFWEASDYGPKRWHGLYTSFKIFDHLTDFHKTWYKYCTVRGHSDVVLFSVLQSVVTMWLMCKFLRWESH